MMLSNLKYLRTTMTAWKIEYRCLKPLTDEEFGLMVARWPHSFSFWCPLLQRRIENDRREERTLYITRAASTMTPGPHEDLTSESHTEIQHWVEGFVTALRSVERKKMEYI